MALVAAMLSNGFVGIAVSVAQDAAKLAPPVHISRPLVPFAAAAADSFSSAADSDPLDFSFPESIPRRWKILGMLDAYFGGWLLTALRYAGIITLRRQVEAFAYQQSEIFLAAAQLKQIRLESVPPFRVRFIAVTDEQKHEGSRPVPYRPLTILAERGPAQLILLSGTALFRTLRYRFAAGPPCKLCDANIPLTQRSIVWTGNSRWYIRLNPTQLAWPALVVSKATHEPFDMTADDVADLAQLAIDLRGWRVFVNDRQIGRTGGGASIPAHKHVQVVPFSFPVEAAPERHSWQDGPVTVSALEWPALVWRFSGDVGHASAVARIAARQYGVLRGPANAPLTAVNAFAAVTGDTFSLYVAERRSPSMDLLYDLPAGAPEVFGAVPIRGPEFIRRYEQLPQQKKHDVLVATLPQIGGAAFTRERSRMYTYTAPGQLLINADGFTPGATAAGGLSVGLGRVATDRPHNEFFPDGKVAEGQQWRNIQKSLPELAGSRTVQAALPTGNIGGNRGYWALSDGVIYRYPDENIEDRDWPVLVWATDGTVSARTVRVVETARGSVRLFAVTAGTVPADITDKVLSVIAAPQLVAAGKNTAAAAAVGLDDIRHALRLPRFQFNGKEFFFGLSDGSGQLYTDRRLCAAAVRGRTVRMSLQPLRDKNISFEQIEREFFRAGYWQQSGARTDELPPGAYRMNAATAEITICFLPGVHPHSAIGLTKDGKLLLAAVGGRTNERGTTLSALADELIAQGAQEAFLWSNGADVSFYQDGQITLEADRATRKGNVWVVIPGEQPVDDLPAAERLRKSAQPAPHPGRYSF